ncbi:MAG: cytochrome c biogenesis protein CcsA [Xanthomonadales bacterium]|nr:cytochrome c biogenesis protein CcsA [Xanthomonadales bacterium]NNL94465.1 cytochrome c biogenesis protein CcsA [Xanthomonadales bacterium]
MHELLLAVTSLAYLAGFVFLYLAMRRSNSKLRRFAVWLTSIGVLAHAASQFQLWSASGPLFISILDVLSLCAMAVIALLLLSLILRRSYFDAAFIALPLSAVSVILEWQLHAPANVLSGASVGMNTHIVSSVAAFGVLSVAGVYALFTALIDHFLRRHHLTRLVRTLPPLEILEGLLFQLNGIGFTLLTLSLGSGLIFVNDLFAQHLAHKTMLSILAWLVFGVLLWGRWRRGWRGRIAVRMTLAGMALLLLSYFGSKLVLEIVLQRSWQT